MKTPLLISASALSLATPLLATDAPSSNPEVEALRKELATLSQTVSHLQKELKTQQARWNGFTQPAAATLGRGHAHSHESHSGSKKSATESHEEDDHSHSENERFNPDISAVIDFVTSYSKSANQWNFTLRNVELTVQSQIDSETRAYAIFAAESELTPTENHDPFNITHVGIEEAAIESTALPWGINLRAGQFFADFTMNGKRHAHHLPFVDRPYSLDATIGGETKTRGFELSWVPQAVPTLRLTGGLVDSIGGHPPLTGTLGGIGGHHHDTHGDEEALFEGGENRPFRSLTGYTRIATHLHIAEGAVLELGGNYAYQGGKNDFRRQIASTDAKFTWQPHPNSRDLFETGAELLWAEESGRFAEHPSQRGNSKAAGGYAYAQYRIGSHWTPGVRIDYTHATPYVEEDGGDHEDHSHSLHQVTQNLWTYSAYLTYHINHSNRLRLQLSYLNSDTEIVPGRGKNDLQAFFQWTVILGKHKHGDATDGHVH